MNDSVRAANSGSRKPDPSFTGSGPAGFNPGRRITALTERQAGFIEGYAAACDDLQRSITGESFSAKSYDPATVELERAVIHSYAFDLKDGGRHHPLSDYRDVDEICCLMGQETLAAINEHQPETTRGN